MYIPSLPNDVAGFWIWLPDAGHQDNRQVMVRKPIMVEAEIHSCELRICTLPFYHLFINGEHIGQGSAFPTSRHCYIDSYEIASHLKPGENTIVISTLELVAPMWNMPALPARIWCQILLNGEPAAATDSTWHIAVNHHFSESQPRCHFGLTCIEKVDFSGIGSGDLMDSGGDLCWQPAAEVQKFPGENPAPIGSGFSPHRWECSAAFPPAASGTFSDSYVATCFNYEGFSHLPSGNYAALTFAFSTEERDVEMRVSTDDPYMVFCNRDLVAANQKPLTLDPYESGDSFQPGMEILEGFAVHLKKGWNQFLCFQNVSGNRCMGLMLLFPDIRKGHLQFQRECSNSVSMIGWTLYGPLHTPFNYSAPQLDLTEFQHVPQAVFIPSAENMNDVSAYLSICDFSLDNRSDPQELHEGEFLVYDLGKCHYGFPCLDISGTPGDIVDITCGLRMGKNQIPATIGALGRRTDTLILGTRTQWIRMIPRGAAYVMIDVRQAKSCVKPVFKFISPDSSLGSSSGFHCSDDLLNDGWCRAMDSLIPCISRNIIDDPCAKRRQTLPESFIYSRLLYHLPGGCGIAEKAIREFAESQLETGMIMKTVPSGIYSYSPDAALIWILWLEDYWMYTGDLDFIRTMEPYLTRLLQFFQLLAVEDHVVLQSERAGHCIFLNKNRDLEERNVFTMLNALYYRALVTASKLYSALKMKEEIILCGKLSSVLEEELATCARSPRTGIFSDSFLGDKRSEKSSVYTNLMVLNAGLIKYSSDIGNLLKFCCRNPEELLNDCDSPFLFFILETLFSLQQNQFAFQLLRMAIDRSLDKPCIYATGGNPHIIGITAAGFMIRQLLGVQPEIPGGTRILFKPACNELSAIQCSIQMGENRISVQWNTSERNLQLDIAAEAPVEIHFQIPDGFKLSSRLSSNITVRP